MMQLYTQATTVLTVVVHQLLDCDEDQMSRKKEPFIIKAGNAVVFNIVSIKD